LQTLGTLFKLLFFKYIFKYQAVMMIARSLILVVIQYSITEGV